MSYADLDRLSRDFAAYLQGLDVKPGARCAIMLPNILQYPVVLFGALRAGLTVVNINPLYTARELRQQLVDADVSVIVVLENFAHVLAEVLHDTAVRHIVITALGDLLDAPHGLLVNFVVRHIKKLVPPYRLPHAVPLRKALAVGGGKPFQPVAIKPDDLAFLQYTGGTTGTAKGAMLTHRNMIANVEQAGAWIGPWTRAGAEVVITALPLYHIFALLANCLLFMRFGALNVLVTNPRDMPGFVRLLRRTPFSAITGVNTLFNGLLNTPGFAGVNFSHLRITLGGGMAVQPVVAKRWKQVTGTTLIEAYGLTEAAPGVCINPLDLAEHNGMIGLPLPSTVCSIQDLQGNLLPADCAGELCVRGPQVMRGYWRNPEETAAVLDAAGWLHTGDIAVMDARGFIRIVDRKKDMILVSGFNVYPSEIEAVAMEHPGVAEAAAIGVADEKTGEAVKLVVVKKDPALTEQALRAHCAACLTHYKRPHHIEFCVSLPKTHIGKVSRRALRE